MGIPHSTTWNSSINNILQYHCSKLEPPTLSLCVSFSSLFALATSKEAWMGDLWSRSNSRGVWTPGFSRHLNDWEIENVEHFSARLLVKGLVEGGGDKVCWSNAKSGTFSVRSLYSSLEEGRSKSFLSGMCGMLGFHLIWVSSLERWLGEKLTLDQLQRRGWSFANKCFLCYTHKESIDHILLHCNKARVLWQLLFSLFGIPWVIHSSIRDTLLGWHGSFVGRIFR